MLKEVVGGGKNSLGRKSCENGCSVNMYADVAVLPVTVFYRDCFYSMKTR